MSSSSALVCPCHSGLRYALCCRPFHKGLALAPHPEALMRSRYAAFVLGLDGYLIDTLAATHPDRLRPRDELARELSAVHTEQRFMGLRVLASSTGGPTGDAPEGGEVLFHARVFVKGQDHSFVELSDFVRETCGWRYAAGVLARATMFREEDLASLTPAEFLARVAAEGR